MKGKKERVIYRSAFKTLRINVVRKQFYRIVVTVIKQINILTVTKLFFTKLSCLIKNHCKAKLPYFNV